MGEVFKQDIKGYDVIQGACFRTDIYDNVIRAVDEGDYSPAQLPSRKRCALCNRDVPHSEQLHDVFLYG